MRQGDIYRRQRAAHQDAGRDHGARRQLPAQDEPRPRGEDGRLQEQPEGAGEGRDRPGPVIGAGRPVDRGVLQREPAPRQRRAHALRHDERPRRLRLLLKARGRRRLLRRAHRDIGRQDLVEQRRDHEHTAAGQREPSQHRVEHEDRREEDRRPRHVEERKDRRRGKQHPDGVDVPGRPLPRGPATGRRTLQRRAKGRPAEDVVHPVTHAGDDPAPGELDHPVECVEHRHEGKQRHQRFLGPRHQHPVVDLQHEERPGQEQEVGEDREQQRHGQKAANPRWADQSMLCLRHRGPRDHQACGPSGRVSGPDETSRRLIHDEFSRNFPGRRGPGRFCARGPVPFRRREERLLSRPRQPCRDARDDGQDHQREDHRQHEGKRTAEDRADRKPGSFRAERMV
jgi:hypothetical protein